METTGSDLETHIAIATSDHSFSDSTIRYPETDAI
jgi:hypothetical protein